MPGLRVVSLGILGCLCSGCGRGFSLLCSWCGFIVYLVGLSVALYVGSGFGLAILCLMCGLGLLGWLACWYLVVFVSG